MVQFLAFSLQDQVEKYGAYVGIAAFFGLAVLTILYFSQARELRRLRDWAGRAPERAQELEARVVANADAARRVQPQPVGSHAPSAAAVAAATAAGSRAGGGGEPATQVVEPAEDAAAAQSGNGTAAAAETAESAAVPPQEPTDGEAGEKPDGDGEKPPETTDEAPGEPAAVPAETSDGEAPAAEGEEAAPAERAAEAPADGGEAAEKPAEEPAAEAEPEAPDDEKPASEAPEAPRPGVIPPAPVPRATPLPRRAPAPAAPLRQPSRSTTLPPRRPAPAPSRRQPARSGGSGRRTSPFALLGVGAGVLVIAAVALFATGVIGGGEDADAPPAPNTTTEPTAQSSPQSGALTPSETKVAVLNGTTTAGLASDAADTIREEGFDGGVTTGNNTDQARAESEVLYGRRSGARRQASTIARGLEIDTIGRLDDATRDLSENADVVVILGQDKAP